MATAEHIKLLIKSHYESEERFKTISLQVAAYEAGKGHTSLARDIKGIIDNARQHNNKEIKFNEDFSELINCTFPSIQLHELVVECAIQKRIERVIKEYRQREKLNKYGLSNRRKIMLVGPPGTGKTMTASILATELKLPLCTVIMDKMITKYMGETSVKLRQVFKAMQEVQGVYLFDEFDAIGANRNKENDVGEVRRVLNSFLQLIEQDTSDSLIVCATNNVEMLDTALFRRFDDVIKYTIPNEQDIERLIRNKLGNFIDRNIIYSNIVKDISCISPAEIVKICEDCIKEAILRDDDRVRDELFNDLVDERRLYHRGEN